MFLCSETLQIGLILVNKTKNTVKTSFRDLYNPEFSIFRKRSKVQFELVWHF